MREFLKGKKTYILSALAIIGVWLDFYLGLGLTEYCAFSDGAEFCEASLDTAIGVTLASLGFSSLRAGVSNG